MTDDTSDLQPFKKCNICGLEKPREAYSRDKGTRDGLRGKCKTCCAEYDRVWQQQNRDKARANALRWNKKNPDRVRAAQRRWHRENPNKAAEYARRYRQNNPENAHASDVRYRAGHAKIMRERTTRWCRANPERMRVIKQREYARKRGAPGKLTAADIEAQYKRQKGKCYYASSECNGPLTIEHVVPLARGGTNWPDNIVLACKHHNSSKQDRLPHEYPQGGRLL